MADFAGGPGNDTFAGGTANDTAEGNGGDDSLSGGAGYDVLAGGAGADTLNGGADGDMLYSNGVSPEWHTPYYDQPGGAPLLDTGSEQDTVSGGAGYDTIFAGYGDNVDGGANGALLLISFQGASVGVTADFRSFQNSGTITVGGGILRNITSVAWVEGSNYDDVITHDGNSDGWFAPVFGLGGNDQLIGGYYTGNLYGGDGNDRLDSRNSQYSGRLYGEAGDDVLLTGSGIGSAYGGAGNDTITGSSYSFGGDGNDIINMGFSYYSPDARGNNGNDRINGGTGDDTRIFGGAGADKLYGNEGDDQLFAAVADDVLSFNGDPWLEADLGLERDSLFGGSGADRLSIGYGDNADGGTGINRLVLSLAGASSGVSLDTASIVTGDQVSFAGGTINHIQSIETIFGSTYGDTISVASQASAATVYGGGGDDVLAVGSGGGTLFGDAGDDTLTGGSGADHLYGGAGIDTINGGGGNDTIHYMRSTDFAAGESIIGGSGTDTIYVNYDYLSGELDLSGATISGIEAIVSSNYDQIKLKASQFDSLTRIVGNFGLVGAGSISMSGVDASSNLYLSGAGNSINLAGLTGNLNVIGGAGNDVVTGNTGAGYVQGGGGDDRLTGGTGADRLQGGAGNDIVDGGDGDDILSVSAGDIISGEKIIGGNGRDQISINSAGFVDLSGVQITGVEKISSDYYYYTIGLGSAQLGAFDQIDMGVTLMNGGAVLLGATNYMAGWFSLSSEGNTIDLKGVVGGGLSHSFTVDGNVGDDVISGDTGKDQLYGGGGADRVSGGGNDDLLSGAAGDDYLSGGAGADELYGGNDRDELHGGAGNDRLFGGDGDDTIFVEDEGDQVIEDYWGGVDTIKTTLANYSLSANLEHLAYLGTVAFSGDGNERDNIITGGIAADLLRGFGGSDTLVGGRGVDRLEGGEGNDTLDGGVGRDTMIGGAGDDVYIVDDALETVTELSGGGIDTVRTALDRFTLAAEIENLTLIGSAGFSGTGNTVANIIDSGSGRDVLKGLEGDDTLRSGANDDVLDGGAGSDTMEGGAGNDRYIVDNSGDVVVELASNGNDGVEASISYALADNVETLKLTGSAAIDGTGNALANSLTGNAAANTLDGGAGADVMTGGLGNDRYVVDNVGDKVIEAAGQGGDTVDASVSFSLAGQYAEVLNLTGDAAINGTGNSLDNRITGNAAANTLSGGAGNDRLDGGAGGDKLVGGTGNDTYVIDNALDKITELPDEGSDTVEASISFSLAGQYLETLKLTGTADINATGNGQANTLVGNSGANVLNGGAGADSMSGGAGDDRYVVDDASDKVVELANEGTDLVESSVSFTLAGQYVENLTLTGSGAVNGTGNGFANLLTGNSAANALNGGAGDDALHGGLGSDVLTGGLGLDSFWFETTLGAANVDRITDFKAADDTIHLDRTIFSAFVTEGVLDASAFRLGSVAVDADDRILYDKATGNLYYDADGVGGAAAKLIAQLAVNTAISSADFFIDA